MSFSLGNICINASHFFYLTILFTFLFFHVVNAEIEKVTEGEKINVTGLVTIESFYEEPNYGQSPESDSIKTACILKLDKQVILQAMSLADDQFHPHEVKQVHLIGSNILADKCIRLLGHRLSVSGTLEQAITGHHHGDALMKGEDFKKIR